MKRPIKDERGFHLAYSRPSPAYHYRRAASEIALMVTIQSTNQRSEWGKDHNVNFGSGDVLGLRPLSFQQPNPVLFFSSGYWTPLTKTAFQLVLSLDGDQELPLSCLDSHDLCVRERSTSARGVTLQRADGRRRFTPVNPKTLKQQRISGDLLASSSSPEFCFIYQHFNTN